MTKPNSCAHQANACRQCQDEWAAAELRRLRAVVKRLASPEAFHVPRVIGTSAPDTELLMRMDYAKNALGDEE